MADTAYGVNDALAVKLWSKKLAVEVLQETYMGRFVGEGSGSLIQLKTETSKGPGDKITFGLRMQLSGDGVSGDGTLEGNEESLTTYSDAVLIDQLRHAVRSKGKASEQRVPFNVRMESKDGLRDWWADRMDEAFFSHIAGNVAQTDLKRAGQNATVAPTAARHIFPPNETTDEGLDSSGDNMTLAMIDRAVVTAKTVSPKIRPIRVKGKEYYVVFMHPYQFHNLRTDSTAAGSWYDEQRALLEGGSKMGDNPIFNGAAGIHNGCIIHVSTRIPKGCNSTTGVEVDDTRRAVLCGAQAAVIAYGQKNADGTMQEGRYSWVEKLFDYNNKLGVSAGSIWGLKKTVFNSTDFGTVVMSTYAAAP